jgi:subtilisin family serine protease
MTVLMAILSRAGRRVWRKPNSFPGIVLALVCVVNVARGQTTQSAAAPYLSDRILIKPKAGLRAEALANLHASHHASVLKTFENLGRIQVVHLPGGETVPGLIEKYQKSGLVEFAEPDYVVSACAAPNDTYYQDGTSWWLNNIGQSGGTPGADIHAPQAWDVLNSASNIVVAVLDSGIRATHEDLAANMWVNPIDGGHGFNAFTGTNDPSDDYGHGTLIAGVLGAVGNNGKGFAGVIWKVQMMSCKCLNNAGKGSDSTVMECIDYARTNGARVMNMSLSAPGVSAAVSNAIVAAQNAGIIIVAASGDGSQFGPHPNVDLVPLREYPACYPMDNIISVAYTSRTDALGTYSCVGPTMVDLAAPGQEISSTAFDSDTSYFISTSTFYLSGSSFAAPMVSGACALMLAKYPSENYQQIIARIFKATDPLPSLAGQCVTGGRLNLWKALSPPINLTAIPGTNGGPLQIHLASGANRSCVIQYSLDLSNWTSLYTNTTDTNGVFDFTDNDSTNAMQRFYRASAAP